MEQNVSVTPIKNTEQAKKYFLSMGCSHFHMSRESFDRYDEYCTFQISDETENMWRREQIEKEFCNFPYEDPIVMASAFSNISAMIFVEKNYLNKLVLLAKEISDNIPIQQINVFLGDIIGRNATKTHGGLIQLAMSQDHKDIAIQLSNICLKLFGKISSSGEECVSLRGYYVDVAQAFNLDINKSILKRLLNEDEEVSYHYYLDGAKSGNIFSMYKAGVYALEGKGCDVDLEIAKYWLEKAASNGHEDAKRALRKIKFK